MDLMSWLRLIIALSGAGAAAYGAWILTKGRVPRGNQRSFRRRTDAGLYYLCFGLALALLALGQLWTEHRQTPLAAAALVAAMVLTGLCIRYRPRRNKRP
jgi:endo-1,4-beta-D-glucanase Y